MAQRFGGEFSPKGHKDTGAPGPTSASGSFRGARRTRAGGRVNLLFLVPFPLIWKAFTSSPVNMAAYLVAFGILILSAWLTRAATKAARIEAGLQAVAEYEAEFGPLTDEGRAWADDVLERHGITGRR